MTPPLSIRSCPLDLGSVLDDEIKKYEEILCLIEGSKCFIVDPLLFEPFMYCSVLKQENQNVKLSKDITDFKAEAYVFVISAVVSTTHLVAYYMRKLKERNKDSQFHIVFIPGKNIMCSQCLREEQDVGDYTLHSLDLSIIPLEDDLISQELNSSFSRMFIKNDRLLPSQFINTICKLHQCSSGISQIHALGDRAESLLETLQKQKKLSQTLPIGNVEIRHLILIDRAVDFASLFVTPLTYEGLIDEILGIDVGCIHVASELIGRRGDEKVRIGLNNDDYLFSEIRNCNVSVLSQMLQKKLYDMQLENTQASTQGKKTVSKVDSFDQLLIHQGISDALINTTNGYLFRQQWQMEHELLSGEQLLDYIVERITLQDSLMRVLRLLCLYSIVNGGLKSKDYDTVRKELIQTYGYETLLLLDRLEIATLMTRRENSKNYTAIRNKLQLVKDVSGEKIQEMHYITSGYAPISARLVELILKEGRLPIDVGRLVGCAYDRYVIKNPPKTNEGGKPVLIVYFLGGVTYTEIAALRYIAKKEGFAYDLVILTTNIINGNHVLDEMKASEPQKIPKVVQNDANFSPFFCVCYN